MFKIRSIAVRLILAISLTVAVACAILGTFSIVQQRSPANDGLSRDWPRAEFGPEKNESYALQWYSLAFLSVALLVILSFRRAAAS